MNIFTIGYEGLNQNRFLDILKTNKIELLVDVRIMPLSRKKGFSKNSLREMVAEKNIDYMHTRQFGCPNPIRDHYKVHKDWDWYTKQFLAHLETLDSEIEAFLPTVLQRRCALMCFEADYQVCHRNFVADRLARFCDHLNVVHLDSNDWLMPKVRVKTNFAAALA